MAQQTAVMELLNFILAERRSKEDGSIKFHAHEDFERFLEMEKEQIAKAWDAGYYGYFSLGIREIEFNNGEEYYDINYNETYNK